MKEKKSVIEERANVAQRALEKVFWNQEKKVYKPFTPYYKEEYIGFHYWWQAHAIDVLLDGYERTNNNKYIDRIDILLEGILEHNKQTIINDYYDDMEWMALAFLRTYHLTGKKSYLDLAKELWNDIEGGWNDICGGGIAWQKNQLYYKNTPANAPAIILALRLYQEEKNSDYLDLAEKIFSWLEDHLVDHDTGFIWDGKNRKKDMRIDKDWEYTYCQGVYVGACVEFYKLTNEKNYLKKAERTIYTTFDRLADQDTKVLEYEGMGDSGLFKGIFIRYVENYLKIHVDKDIENLIYKNGQYAWRSSQSHKEQLFGAYWSNNNQASTVTLSTHLSGCMLMESIYRLKNENVG